MEYSEKKLYTFSKLSERPFTEVQVCSGEIVRVYRDKHLGVIKGRLTEVTRGYLVLDTSEQYTSATRNIPIECITDITKIDIK